MTLLCGYCDLDSATLVLPPWDILAPHSSLVKLIQCIVLDMNSLLQDVLISGSVTPVETQDKLQRMQSQLEEQVSRSLRSLKAALGEHQSILHQMK